ncbi:membrane-spanning 4-domains subfamily A member 3-like [Embiotoca jacksoni]|uniref:membrane-spanning 4-domains subfamily A member 3-like n=1 Tax=Embiotoca jacksoni TaxID=100190 RepID=UPI00370432DA
MSASSSAGGVFVVTHVITAPQAAAAPQNPLSPEKHRFMRGRPEALGTVQILVGLTVVLVELTMVSFEFSLGIHSGIFIWGALSYITAGSLTVAAGRSLKRSQVNTALGFNIVAAVSSAVASAIYVVDAIQFFTANNYYGISYYWSTPNNDCLVHAGGISSVLAVFSVLQFTVSNCVIVANGCKASGQPTDQQPIVVTNQSVIPALETQEAPPMYEPPPISGDPQYEYGMCFEDREASREQQQQNLTTSH